MPEQTPAERRALLFADSVKKNYRGGDSARFEITVTVNDSDRGTQFDDGSWMLLPTVSAVVRIYDKLVGGSLWAQWITYVGQPGKPGSTKFYGGYYRWTMVGKEHRIRKSMPHLYRITSVLVHD